METLSQSAVSC